MKTIEVSAAIIIKNNKIFITQKGYGEYKDYWEFPGGKIEEKESKEEALIREVKEELKVNITIQNYIGLIKYKYPSFNLIMYCFIAKFKEENYILLEHEAAKYIDINELKNINFLPADKLVINKIKEYFLNKN